MPGAGMLYLPNTTIYGFSTTPNIPNTPHFPGAMIYANYGQPGCLRLENQLDDDGGLDRMDLGHRSGASSFTCTTVTPRARAMASRMPSRATTRRGLVRQPVPELPGRERPA
jgi:hypothetical protein